MRQPTDESEIRLAQLRRALKIVLPIAGLLQVATIISIPALPGLVFALIVPDIIAIAGVVMLDRAIVAAGGESWWKNGRFRAE
jgi:hypothetical protein